MTQQQSTKATEPSRRDVREALIAALEKLRRDGDRAALARLRRTVGKSPGEAAEAFRYVAPYTEWANLWQESCRYLVAGLFALESRERAREALAVSGESFGATVRRLAVSDPSRGDAIDRRFTVLLASDERELPARLRQMVKLVGSARTQLSIDWRTLLLQLEAWNDERRWVQRRWARDFWRLPEGDRLAEEGNDAGDLGVDAADGPDNE